MAYKIKGKPLDLISNIIQHFANDVIKKYAKGHIEHGGFLLERDLKLERRDEILDLVVYEYAQMLKEDRDYKD